MINPHGLLSAPAGEATSRDQEFSDRPTESSSEPGGPGFAAQLQQESRPLPDKEKTAISKSPESDNQSDESALPDGKRLPARGSELPTEAGTNLITRHQGAAGAGTGTKAGAEIAAELVGNLGHSNLESDATLVEQALDSEMPAELELLQARHLRNTELRAVATEAEGVSKQRAGEGVAKFLEPGMVRGEESAIKAKASDDLPFLPGNKLSNAAQSIQAADPSSTARRGNTGSQTQAGQVDFTSMAQTQWAETRKIITGLQSDQGVSADKLLNLEKAAPAQQSQSAQTVSSLAPSNQGVGAPALASQSLDRGIGNLGTSAGEAQSGKTPASELVSNLDNRVRMMMTQGMNSAKLQLSPYELGALEIHLSGEGDQAKVSVIAQSQQARELLEQQLPRLREVLEQQGIRLSDADVSDGSGQPGNRQDESTTDSSSSGSSLDAEIDPSAEEASTARSKPMQDSQIDFYA